MKRSSSMPNQSKLIIENTSISFSKKACHLSALNSSGLLSTVSKYGIHLKVKFQKLFQMKVMSY